jgi:hypothetical protein
MAKELNDAALTLQSFGKTPLRCEPNPGKVIETAWSRMRRALLPSVLLGLLF